VDELVGVGDGVLVAVAGVPDNVTVGVIKVGVLVGEGVRLISIVGVIVCVGSLVLVDDGVTDADAVGVLVRVLVAVTKSSPAITAIGPCFSIVESVLTASNM
jgi:hypothetical protein